MGDRFAEEGQGATAIRFSDRIFRCLWERQWIPPRHARFLYKKMTKAGIAPSHPFGVDFYGLTYLGDLASSIDFHVFYYGAFEKGLLHFLEDAMRARAPGGGVFLDVGANVGQHSLFMSRVSRQVHAFEPYELVRAKLVEHVRANQLENVEIHSVGLGNEQARLPFYAPAGKNLGVGSFKEEADAGTRYVGELEVVAGDGFLADRGIDEIDLIKVDVEGFEKRVLEGLRETLTRFRPILVVELTYHLDISFANENQLLKALPPDYRLFSFDTRKANGKKSRRKGKRVRRKGEYRLIPFRFGRPGSQDDVVACPAEWVDRLPKRGRAPSSYAS